MAGEDQVKHPLEVGTKASWLAVWILLPYKNRSLKNNWFKVRGTLYSSDCPLTGGDHFTVARKGLRDCWFASRPGNPKVGGSWFALNDFSKIVIFLRSFPPASLTKLESSSSSLMTCSSMMIEGQIVWESFDWSLPTFHSHRTLLEARWGDWKIAAGFSGVRKSKRVFTLPRLRIQFSTFQVP